MKSFHTHRVIDSIEKQRKLGKSLIFLTGPAINERDRFLFSQYHGVQTLSESLKLFYLCGPQAHTWFIHVRDSASHVEVSKPSTNGSFVDGCELDTYVGPPTRKGDLNRQPNHNTPQAEEAQRTARDATEGSNIVLNSIDETLKKKKERTFIFFENLDLIAKLHNSEPDLAILNHLRNWQTFHHVTIIVTISDMELLKKYSFPDESCFIGYPDAHEIYATLWRYMLRKHPDTEIHTPALEEISYALVSSKKSLNSCMRILAKFKNSPVEKLQLEDFQENFEKGIEEKVLWEDVCLKEDIKNQIEAAIDAFISAANSRNGNNLARKGLIFSGPPGTGKTLIAKALANEKQCYFMAPTLADLKGQYVGETGKQIQKIFAEARASQPTLLFIDEADTVFPARDDGRGDSFGLDMVNQFLQEIDGAGTGTQKIFVIAATNRPDAIDPAIRSRLGAPLEIPLPDKEMRLKLFDANFKKLRPEHPFTLKGTGFEEYVLTHSDGMSGRDITNFVKRLCENFAGELKNDDNTEEVFHKWFAKEKDELLRQIKTVFMGDNIVEPNSNSVSFSRVQGRQSLLDRLADYAEYIGSPELREKYDRHGVEPAKGILLYGPPGNGKTHIVKALAGENKFYLFKVLSRDFSGNSSKDILDRLQEIFDLVLRFSRQLEGNEGVVLFFDEFDSLASEEVLTPVVRGTLLDYLSNEQGLRKKDSRVLFIAATNYPERLDKAVIRKGRIDSHIFIDNVQKADALEILKTLTSDSSKVEISDGTLEDAYDRQSEIFSQRRKREQAIKHLSLKQRGLSPEDFMQNTIVKGLSYAELQELYRGLKEVALHMNKISNNKLFVDEEVVEKFFSSTSQLRNPDDGEL